MTGADVGGLDETLGIPLIWGPGSAAEAVVVMFADTWDTKAGRGG